jgi:signal peptidase II
MNVLKNKKVNSFLSANKKNNLICSLIVIFIFFLDRISKIKIINHQVNNDQIYINDYVNFDLIWNNGIGFGLLSSSSNLIYNIISGIIGLIIIFIIYLMIKSKILDKILFSAVLGGALGNLYDRLTYFAVPDFIDIHYERFHWFTFNIADIFITIGILGLIGKDLFIKNEKF